MGASIRLARSKIPTFPDRCVFCGAEHPGETVKLLAYPPGQGTRIVVPTCRTCRYSMRRPWKIALGVLVGLTALAGGFLLAGLLQGLGETIANALGRPRLAGAVTGVAAGCGGVCFTILVFVCVRLWPPALWVEASASDVVFTFRDEAYGREFDMLNSPEQVASRDGGRNPV
jgi:hypothetical protein